MAPPYSERFLAQILEADTPGEQYEVPTGKRAIISCVSVNSDGADPGVFYLLLITDPDTIALVSTDVILYTPIFFGGLHIVVYAGESFGAFCAGVGAHVTVSGYLLADP